MVRKNKYYPVGRMLLRRLFAGMDSDVTNLTLKALRRILRATDLGGRRLATATGLTPSQLLVLQEIDRRGEATPSIIASSLWFRSDVQPSELQSIMRTPYAFSS